MARTRSAIVYIERTDHVGQTHWARIGRAEFSKTGRSRRYDGMELRGTGRGWYVEVETGEHYWAQAMRADAPLRNNKPRKGGPRRVAIDEDAREEYWINVCDEPAASTSGRSASDDGTSSRRGLETSAPASSALKARARPIH